MNSNKPHYTLSQVLAFAGPSAEEQKELIGILLDAAGNNLNAFRTQIEAKDRSQVCEIAHKMLTLFRQLQASAIVDKLQELEKENSPLDNSAYFEMGTKTAEAIAELLQDIRQSTSTGDL